MRTWIKRAFVLAFAASGVGLFLLASYGPSDSIAHFTSIVSRIVVYTTFVAISILLLAMVLPEQGAIIAFFRKLTTVDPVPYIPDTQEMHQPATSKAMEAELDERYGVKVTLKAPLEFTVDSAVPFSSEGARSKFCSYVATKFIEYHRETLDQEGVDVKQVRLDPTPFDDKRTRLYLFDIIYEMNRAIRDALKRARDLMDARPMLRRIASGALAAVLLVTPSIALQEYLILNRSPACMKIDENGEIHDLQFGLAPAPPNPSV